MGDFDRSHRNEFRYPAADHYRRSFGGADHDRGHRPYHDGSAASDYDRGYRDQFLAYGAGAGDRKLEIVKGNVFSANQSSYSARDTSPPPRRRSPEPTFRARRGRSSAATSGGSGAWCFSDPEAKRRRRVASYKAYSAEGKMKASLRKGLRWIKVKCSELVRGW